MHDFLKWAEVQIAAAGGQSSLSPLHFAILTLDVAEVKRLIQQEDKSDSSDSLTNSESIVNEPARCLNGMTPLMLAARIGSPKIVLALLIANADGNIRDNSRLKPLDHAFMGPWCLDPKSFQSIQRCLNICLPFLKAAKFFGGFKHNETMKMEDKLTAIEQIGKKFFAYNFLIKFQNYSIK